MPETQQSPLSSWFSKFIECLFGWLVLAQLVFWVMDTLISPSISNYNLNYWISFFTDNCWIFAVISVGFAFWWRRLEKAGKINSPLVHAWLRGALRYFLAYAISVYGFAKILKTQFATSYYHADMLVGNMSGFELTWNYFGYSHTFAVILGLVQIGGSILLLFRRTSLLGVFILLPVMVNIVLINLFYHIALGAFINSLFFTFGLLYLLLLRWHELKVLFLKDSSTLPRVRMGFLKPVLKALVVAAAFGTIYQYVVNFKPAVFPGKWEVEAISRNGKLIPDSAWRNNAWWWKDIYMEERGMLEVSANRDHFDNKNAKWGSYTYDPPKHLLKLSFTQPGYAADTMDVTVSDATAKGMQWAIVINSDTLRYRLEKIEKLQ